MKEITLCLLLLLVRSPLIEAADQREPTFKTPMAQRASKWICAPVVRHDCAAGGCSAAKPSVGVVLDFARDQYSRCDAKGCDAYPMAVTTSGVYTTATPSDRGGVFLKARNDGAEYVEVISSGTSVLVTFGICEPKR